MKNESFDQVFQLGMVAVKVIVLFLLVMVSVLLGIIWYQSELEISFLNNNTAEETMPVESVEQAPATVDETEEPSDTSEGEVSATVVAVDPLTSTMTVQLAGNLSQTTITYTSETTFVSQTTPDTDTSSTVSAQPITVEDIIEEDSILLTITPESLMDEDNWVAEQIVVVPAE